MSQYAVTSTVPLPKPFRAGSFWHERSEDELRSSRAKARWALCLLWETCVGCNVNPVLRARKAMAFWMMRPLCGACHASGLALPTYSDLIERTCLDAPALADFVTFVQAETVERNYSHEFSPEQKLLTQVIGRAVDDLIAEDSVVNRVNARTREAAQRWLLDDETSHDDGFSFHDCCEFLNLDVQQTRAALLALIKSYQGRPREWTTALYGDYFESATIPQAYRLDPPSPIVRAPKGRIRMANDGKFVLKKKPIEEETRPVMAHLTFDMETSRRLRQIGGQTDYSYNELVRMMVEYALDHLVIETATPTE